MNTRTDPRRSQLTGMKKPTRAYGKDYPERVRTAMLLIPSGVFSTKEYFAKVAINRSLFTVLAHYGMLRHIKGPRSGRVQYIGPSTVTAELAEFITLALRVYNSDSNDGPNRADALPPVPDKFVTEVMMSYLRKKEGTIVPQPTEKDEPEIQFGPPPASNLVHLRFWRLEIVVSWLKK